MSYVKLAKNIFTVGFLDLLGMVQGLFFLSLITKILGAQDYGIWSQIRVTMSLVVSFSFLGLHESLVRFIPGEKDKENIKEGVYSSAAIAFLINLAVAFLLMVFSGPISLFLKFDQIFVRLLSLIIIFESLNTIFLVVIRVLREIGKYFWFVTSKMLLEIGMLTVIMLFGYGLLEAVVSFLIIRIIVFLSLSIYIISKIGFKLPDFSLIKKYLSFGLPTMADGASYWMITSLDRYLIGFFLGIIFVGYYVPAYSVAYIISIFIFPVSFMLSVVLPKFFDDNNVKEVKNHLRYSLKYFLAVIIPAVFGVSILSRELLVIFSTKEIADNAYFVVPFIALSIAMYGATYFFSQILVLAKKTKVIASIWVASALLNLGLNLIFIPVFGILGAAITTFLAYFFSLALIYFLASRELKFTIEWNFIFKSLIASVFMGFFVYWINLQGFWGLMLSILFGIAVYFVLMALFKGLDKKEIIFFKKLAHEMVVFNK